MRVITIQHKNVLNNLINDGVHFLKDDKCFEFSDNFSNEGLKDLYAFMIKNMSNIENKYNAISPVWVYKNDEVFKKSGRENNIREALKELEYDDDIIINLDIPEELILLSNHKYFEDYLMCYKVIAVNNKERKYYNKCSIEEKMNTWNRIFMEEPAKDWEIKHPKDCIWQGCLWYLKKEWIID